MKYRLRHDRQKRIFYPANSWIPVHSDVFEKVFPRLKERLAAHLYMAMYERASQVRSREFAMNLRDLSELIKCDPRTARKCIIELVGKGFVKMVDEGRANRSRTDKPRFRVPLVESELAEGRWVPVPRFLVTRYLPEFPGSLLLIVLLSFQHINWNDHCWMSAQLLGTITKWKRRTIYHALNLMGHRHRWEKLRTGLPWPLEIRYSGDWERRHFSVRAVQYYCPPGAKVKVVGLSKEFTTHFGFRKHPRQSIRTLRSRTC
jgi:hypothetical protein